MGAVVTGNQSGVVGSREHRRSRSLEVMGERKLVKGFLVCLDGDQ